MRPISSPWLTRHPVGGSLKAMDSQDLPIAGRLAPRRPMALKPVGRAALGAAGKVLAKYGLGEQALIERWAEIVGENLAGLTLPVHLSRRTDTLTLRVAGPFAVELMHQEAELVSRINTYCGRLLVKRLKLVQGPIARLKPRRPQPRPLSPAEEDALARRAAPIADANLRSALISLGRAIRTRS